jgi:hypothetical protein
MSRYFEMYGDASLSPTGSLSGLGTDSYFTQEDEPDPYYLSEECRKAHCYDCTGEHCLCPCMHMGR